MRSRPIALAAARSIVSQVEPETALSRACLCARIAEEYRGQETVVLDLTGITPIVDYFVITTGSSSRQMHALATEVSREMKAHGSRPFGKEGEQGGTWILHDFGDVVLHVFNAETRKLYDLEHLWADAPHIAWQQRS